MDAHVDTLVSEQASFALNRAGFRLVYERMQTWDGSTPLSRLPNMDAASLQSVMVSLHHAVQDITSVYFNASLFFSACFVEYFRRFSGFTRFSVTSSVFPSHFTNCKVRSNTLFTYVHVAFLTFQSGNHFFLGRRSGSSVYRWSRCVTRTSTQLSTTPRTSIQTLQVSCQENRSKSPNYCFEWKYRKLPGVEVVGV